MIDPQDRFWSEGQNYCGPRENPTPKTYYNVWDWDQLRMVKVKGTAKLFPPEEDRELSILARFANYLSPEVRAITVDDDGLLTGLPTDLEEDYTLYFLHMFLSRSVARWPMAVQMAWDELNIFNSLPPHPNIIPFDRVVVEDQESRVIGFTTKYIPGGTLANPKILFRFEWLQQVTQVVDFLNLELGVMHQDIAPCNLLIDPYTQKIVLFDFDRATSRKKRLYEGRDDVTSVVFTLYELITNDTCIPHWDRHIGMVQSISEWIVNRELDSDVSKFRNFLSQWVATRRSDGDMERYLNAPHRFTWPDLPTAPDYNVPFEMGTT
ncbi:unnamed protein product [Penicillium egyptiacum]|uniref:EKC/KEOPS complex subunit BUD32 n=1 Tax=Penicillium egyptiacum TaxID=1303716 RepID=A0A9W4K4E6_9EURO|nr:unnamed protein product [Penicillium egyptiacum]